MPTATSTLGVSLTNWGPLTTTYTAPASCLSDAHYVAFAQKDTPDILEWSETCDWEIDACLPPPADPKATGDLEDQIGSEDLSTPYLQSYYSPGSICPSGWKTVGVAARSGDAPISTTGVFSPAASGDAPPVLNPHDILALALEPSETAIACCPTDMDAAPNGGCTSTLPSYSITTGCARVFPALSLDTATETITQGDLTVTGVLHSVTGSPDVTVTTTTFKSDDATAYTAVSRMPMVLIVHESESTDDPNAAGIVRPFGSGYRTGGPWGQVMGVMGVVTAAALAGAALVAPW